MRYKALLSIGLGLGLALGSGTVFAQDTPVTDSLTKPLGADDPNNNKAGDKNKPSTQSKGDAANGSQKASFGALDINTDRKLSRDEVKTNTTLSTDFDKLDSDRNGSLSDAEFAKFEDSGKKDNDKSTKDKAKSEGQQAKDKAKREGDRAEDNAEDKMN